MKEWLTVKEAALKLNASPNFVRKLVRNRQIVFARFGKLVRVEAASLDEYIAANRKGVAGIPATPPRRRLAGLTADLIQEIERAERLTAARTAKQRPA